MKIFPYALLLLIVFAATAQASAVPVRIARLPIIFQSTVPDRDTCAELEVKIARAIYIPLNKTFPIAEYIPVRESQQALSYIWQDMRTKNKKAKLADAMRPLAQMLNADIVICPVLLRYSQNATFSVWDETIIDSQARAELIVYDRRTDTLIDKKSMQMYHDSYHPLGTASTLAKICFDRVINETNLRQLIRSIK